VVRSLWCGVLAAIAVAGCRTPATPERDGGPPAARAFYYWKTTFRLSPDEEQALATLHISRIYVRAFDIVWNDVPEFAGKLELASDAHVPEIDFVPVVFVKDEVFRKLPAARIATLADDTWREVTARMNKFGHALHEVQLDCDWTDTTRDAYFAFLRAMAQHATVTATIRLHQIKYREHTGVPPVARGMLMFYNMGRFSADPDARSIFDAASAERYLARLGDYPLPLDVALPIWSWTLHLRDERVEGLLQSTDPDELASLEFLAPAGADRYVVRRTALLHGTLLREGDILKTEVTGPAETLAAAELVARSLAPVTRPRTISLFDLSERNLARHGTSSLDRVFRSVH
jgi:hypothetical protein